MSTVTLTDAGPGAVAIRFTYDRELVELLKACVPAYARRWDATWKTWTVDGYPLDHFLGAARTAGHNVIDGRAASTPPPRARRPEPPREWAEELLLAVGPERREAVFRALTRVLHPDTPTGDVRLMQALNGARDRLAA